MGSLTNYGEQAFVNHLCGTSYTSVATVYLALHTADPTDAATGAEVANSNNYAREALSFGAAASRRVTQNADVTFNQASGSWGTVTHWAIWDNATHGAGNMLAHGAFSTSFAPVSGNTPSITGTQIYVEVQANAGSGFSNFYVHSFLNLMFRNVSFAQPATYVFLSNTVLDDADASEADFTEVSGTGYARELVNKAGGASPNWETVTSGATQNEDIIDFGTVGSGGWSNIVAAGLITSASGAGSILAWDSANVVDQTGVVENDTVTFPVGQFDIALTD